VPKPYIGAELPLALALALGGVHGRDIDAALAGHHNQVIDRLAEMLRSLSPDGQPDPGRAGAVERLLAARVPEGD
jgi:hypothetical protein